MGTSTSSSHRRATVIAVLMATILAFGICLTFGASKAWAGGYEIIEDMGKSVSLSVIGKKEFRYYGSNTKAIKSPKSSKKSVVSVKSLYDNIMQVTLKKPGVAKVSFKLGGKKKTITFKVKKYKNPVKVFKIGTTDYASQFKKSRAATNGHVGGALTVKPAKGWKVKAIRTFGETNLIKIKNGSIVDEGGFVQVQLKNKKTGVEEFIVLA